MFEELFSVNGISIDRLKNFVDVAEKGSIARVADGDASRQSLISRQISELEVFFGTQLTRRKGKGLELTEAGQELTRQTRLQFQGLADFKASCSGQPVEYQIAAGNSVIEWLVAPDMAGLAETVPKGTFTLLDWRTGDIIRGLLNHIVDFGIVRKTALVRPLKFKPIGSLSYGLFVPTGNKAMAKTPFEEMPLAISIGGEFRSMFEEAAARAGKRPTIVYRCTSFTQAAQLVRHGVAAAVLPLSATAALAGLSTIQPLPWLKEIVRDLGVAWHQRLLDVRPHAGEVLLELQRTLRSRIERNE